MRIPLQKLVDMLDEFASLLEAGVPVTVALTTIEENSRHHLTKVTLSALVTRLKGGATLGEALRSVASRFPPLAIALLEVGEHSGKLDVVSRRLAQYYNTRRRMRSRIITSLIYPAIYLVLGTGLSVLAVTLMARMGFMEGAGSRVVVMVTFCAAVIAAALLTGMIRRTDSGRLATDALLLAVPVIGAAARNVAIANFTYALYLMNSAGVPLLDAIERASGTAGNAVLEHGLRKALKELAGGATLRAAMDSAKFFPGAYLAKIAVAEDSGKLDETAERIAVDYQDRVETSLSRMATVLAMAILVGVLAMIGYFIISFWVNFYGGMLDMDKVLGP